MLNLFVRLTKIIASSARILVSNFLIWSSKCPELVMTNMCTLIKNSDSILSYHWWFYLFMKKWFVLLNTFNFFLLSPIYFLISRTGQRCFIVLSDDATFDPDYKEDCHFFSFIFMFYAYICLSSGEQRCHPRQWSWEGDSTLCFGCIH